MKKIICRFRNQEDLDNFGKRIGINLTQNTKEVNTITKDVKIKREVKSKGRKSVEWENHWKDMPEFNIDFKEEVYAKIDFIFKEDADLDLLSKVFNQNITKKTTSVWFPKLIHGLHRDLRIIGGENPKYPVYVVSKGRFEVKNWHTSFRLSQMCVPHYLVVEPQEYDIYKQNFNNEYVEIIKMDMSYRDTYDCFSDLGNTDSTGPGAARNFVWEHSMKNGHKWHWVMDDNVDGFNRYWRGKRLLARTGEVLRSCERFVDRYDNIAIAGLNYSKFCLDGGRHPAYTTNTRIYSMLLIKNDIPYRWRGRYNEDTDLSLRVLKDGWCTVQFNAFLGEKMTTQKVKGGNTDEFYDKEGTKPKTQMLVDMHPDVTKMVFKFNRWHHVVDYSGYKQKLRLKDGLHIDDNINEYGLKVVRIPRDLCNTPNDNRKYIEEHFNSNEFRVDNTDLYL